MEKHKLSEMLNALFAGEFKITVCKTISFVDFENSESSEVVYSGTDSYTGNKYRLITIGGNEIQGIIAGAEFVAKSNTAEVIQTSKGALSAQHDLSSGEQLEESASETPATSLIENWQQHEYYLLRCNSESFNENIILGRQ